MELDGRTTAGPSSRLVSVALVVGVVLMALVGGWWLVGPDALEPVANGVVLEASDDRPRLTSDVVSNRRPVELVSVRPVTPAPEGARVTIVACRWRDPLTAFATGSGAFDEHCSETREVAGFRLAPHKSRPVGDGTFVATREWEILMGVELGDQPAYVTEGFIVEYREGIRRGQQTTGTQVAVHRPGHEPAP